MKLLNYFKKDNSLLVEIEDLQEALEQVKKEKEKICNSKKIIEDCYEKLKESFDEIQKKYIELLEEKSEKFDLYLSYKEQCKNLTDEKKKLKKEVALLKEKRHERNS